MVSVTVKTTNFPKGLSEKEKENAEVFPFDVH